MDPLHRINLPIFQEFQEYYVETFFVDITGLTQADVERNPGKINDLWLCFRTAWIYGNSAGPSGHDEPCYYCKKPCDGLAAAPTQWPIPLCHADDPGRVKWHHIGCVMQRLRPDDER